MDGTGTACESVVVGVRIPLGSPLIKTKWVPLIFPPDDDAMVTLMAGAGAGEEDFGRFLPAAAAAAVSSRLDSRDNLFD